MARSDHREVPTVKCRNGLLVESFGCRDDRSIDCPKWEVPVSVDEFGDSKPICGGDGLDCQITAGQVAEEPHFGIGTESAADEVDDYCASKFCVSNDKIVATWRCLDATRTMSVTDNLRTAGFAWVHVPPSTQRRSPAIPISDQQTPLRPGGT